MLRIGSRLLCFLLPFVRECHSFEVFDSLQHAEYVNGLKLAEIIDVVQTEALHYAILISTSSLRDVGLI